MHVSVFDIDRVLYDKEAKKIFVSIQDGEIEILNGYEDLISEIGISSIRIVPIDSNLELSFYIESGVFMLKNNIVYVVSDERIESDSDINQLSTNDMYKEKEKIESLINKYGLNEYSYAKLIADISRVRTKLGILIKRKQNNN